VKFGAVPLAEAEGAILAHAVKLARTTFKKGRVLSREDVAALKESGHENVIAARLEDGDVPEDRAAAQIATAIAGDGLVTGAAFTGRANLYARERGIAVVDHTRLDCINQIDEAITLATVAPWTLLDARSMAATIKIIPFAVSSASLARVLDLARDGGPIMRVAALEPHQAALIQTRLAGTKPGVLDKTAETTRARLAALGSTLADSAVCAHDQAAVTAALQAQIAAGRAPIMVLGASAIVDRRDVIPAAITAAGGELIHFGMPVDPGNLLLLGKIGETPVIGLPGCARSPKLNGFDWVLQRLLAKLKVTRADLMHMGAGGLLAETERPLPRREASPEPVVALPRAPRIAAVVLAAGRSSRMAPANKMLAPVDGAPMVARVVDTVSASQAGPVIVVVGNDAARVKAALARRDVRFVDNPNFADGLSTSVRAGLAALQADVDGALFVLGDMPRVTAAQIDRLIAAFNPVEGRAICIPTHRAKRGNPVLWGAKFFAELRALSGDTGARGLISQHIDQVCEVEMDDDGVLIDVDTPDALAALRREAG
jgi:molybdenum cofactor cytidylyltransferase